MACPVSSDISRCVSNKRYCARKMWRIYHYTSAWQETCRCVVKKTADVATLPTRNHHEQKHYRGITSIPVPETPRTLAVRFIMVVPHCYITLSESIQHLPLYRKQTLVTEAFNVLQNQFQSSCCVTIQFFLVNNLCIYLSDFQMNVFLL